MAFEKPFKSLISLPFHILLGLKCRHTIGFYEQNIIIIVVFVKKPRQDAQYRSGWNSSSSRPTHLASAAQLPVNTPVVTHKGRATANIVKFLYSRKYIL